MSDKRKDNGGARKGAGRPSKADELKVVKLGTEAIIRVYGSIDEYYDHIATESKESFPHLRLLQEYVFGKPKETIETTVINEDLSTDDIDRLAKKLKADY